MRYFRREIRTATPHEKFIQEQRDAFMGKLEEGIKTKNHALIRVANTGLGYCRDYNSQEHLQYLVHTNFFIEMDKEDYDEVVILEKEMMKREYIIKSGLSCYHCPVKTDLEDYESFLKELSGEEEIDVMTLDW